MNERLRRCSMGAMLSLAILGFAGLGTAAGLDETANSPNSVFLLEQVQWQHRVLVVSASKPDDTAFQLQLAEVDASQVRFDERDLLLVTLLDGVGSTAGDRPLTRAEVDRIRAEIDIGEKRFEVRLIGKDGRVKLARDAVVSMDEIYALIDTMPMRRSEMAR